MREHTGSPEADTVAAHYANDLVLVVGNGEVVAPAPDGYEGASTLIYEAGDAVPKAQVSVAEFRSLADRLALMTPEGGVAHGVSLARMIHPTTGNRDLARAAARGEGTGFDPGDHTAAGGA